MADGRPDASLALWDFNRSNKHCIPLFTAKTIYFSHFVFSMSAFAPIEISYSNIVITRQLSVNKFSFLSHGSHYQTFFSVQAQTEMVKGFCLLRHFYFLQNNHFFIKYESYIVFSVFFQWNLKNRMQPPEVFCKKMLRDAGTGLFLWILCNF